MYRTKFFSATLVACLILVGATIYLFHNYYWLILGGISVPLFVCAVLLGRKANESLFARISPGERRAAAFHAALSYSPLALALVLGVFAQWYLSYFLREEMYEYQVVLVSKADTRPNSIVYGGRSFDGDIKFTLDTRIDESAQVARAAFDDLVKNTKGGVEQSRRAIPGAMANLFDRDLITGRCPRGTGWLCRRVNRSYRAGVQKQNAKLQGELNQIAEKARTNEAAARAEGEALIAATTTQAKAAAHASVDAVFAGLAVLSGLALLALFLAIVKSYGYLFSRWLLTDNAATQNFATQKMRERRVDFELPRQTNKLEIDLEDGESFYVSTGLNFLGDTEKKSIPKWSSIVSNRLFERLYIVHRIDGRTGRGSDLVVEANLGDQFVRVDLRENEELFFNIRYLCGFSDTVTFSKYVNLRVIAMVFGRMAYLSASGPGTVVFLVPGGCVETKRDQEFLQHRLIAWKSTAEFSVRSSLGIQDLYFSGISISASVGGTCIIENATGRKHRRYVSRFFWRFMWPL